MKEIPYESGSYYVFDRGYNAFKELFKIHLHESFFVVRAKKNLQCKCCKWRRRLPKNILTDAEIEFTEYNSFRKYPERLIRWRTRQGVCLPDKCFSSNSSWNRQPLKEQMADRAVLQMAKAAPQDQEVLEYYRECCENPNLIGYHSLLPCCYRTTWFAT